MSLVRRALPLSLALVLTLASGGVALGHASGTGAVGYRQARRHDDRSRRTCHYADSGKQDHEALPQVGLRKTSADAHLSTAAIVHVTGQLSAEGWAPPPGVSCPLAR